MPPTVTLSEKLIRIADQLSTFSDQRLADQFTTSRTYISRLRKRLALPAYRRPVRSSTSVMDMPAKPMLADKLIAYGADLAQFTDTDLAKQFQTSRAYINKLRNRYGLPKKLWSPLYTAAAKDCVIQSLSEGLMAKDVATTCGVSSTYVVQIGQEIGWTKDWRVIDKINKLSDYVGKLPRATVLTLLELGESHSRIAHQAGVSRERIRQVRATAGMTSERVVQKLAREEKDRRHAASIVMREKARDETQQARREASREALAKHMTKARGMWAMGLSIKVIANAYHMTPFQFSPRIHDARLRLGLHWFPYRHRPKTVIAQPDYVSVDH